MMRHGTALVILPTFNEVENLEPMVQAILRQDLGLHILVVDDNSPDGTGLLADRLASRYVEVHVLHRPRKLGLGPAYIAGFRWALARDYAYVFEMDCDFSHNPATLPVFLEEIVRAELVIGSRYMPGGSTPDWPPLRRMTSRFGNLYARALLGLQVRDATSGFRCYRRALLAQIPWDKITLRGYGFQVAAVFHAERLGARILEVPITFRDRRAGKSKMTMAIALEAFLYVLRLALTQTQRIDVA